MTEYINHLKSKEIKLNKQGFSINESDIYYTIGKFKIMLTDKGDLRVIVHTNSDSLKIQPKSDNSIIIHASK